MGQSYLHRVSGNIAFNAHHSPMGAFFTFTCGNFGTPGGLAAQATRPANQDIFIGVKDGDRRSTEPLRCLPFFTGAVDTSAAAYLGEQAGKVAAKPTLTAYPKDQIQRFYSWASDRWVTDDLQFTIYTPFTEIPEPGKASVETMRAGLLPAVIAELTVDNTAGKTVKTAVFAIRFPDPGTRLIADLGAGRLGFGNRRTYGGAGEMLDHGEAAPIFRWDPDAALVDVNLVHDLGNCPGITF